MIALCSMAVGGGCSRESDATPSLVDDGPTSVATVPVDQPIGTQPGDASATLPPIEAADAAASASYLAGDGRALVALLETARPLSTLPAPPVAECTAALEALATGPPPDELGGLAGDVPDAVLAAAFLDVITSTDEYLTRCVESGSPGEALGRLQASIALTDERMGAL